MFIVRLRHVMGYSAVMNVTLTIFEDLFDGYWQGRNIVFSSHNAESETILRSRQLHHLEIRPEVDRSMS